MVGSGAISLCAREGWALAEKLRPDWGEIQGGCHLHIDQCAVKGNDTENDEQPNAKTPQAYGVRPLSPFPLSSLPPHPE